MTTRFSGHLLNGDHASRPAATAVPEGTLYSCTDHALLYQSDGTSAWSTWATLGGGSPGAHASTHEDGGADEIDVTGLVGAGGGAGDGYDAGYDPRRPPSSGLNAVTDEFADSSLHADWSWVPSAPAATVSETEYPDWLHFLGGTDASGTEHKLRRDYAPGAGEFSAAGRFRFAMPNGNFSCGVGLGILNSSDGVIAGMRLFTDGTSTGSDAFRIFWGAGAVGTAFGPFSVPLGMVDMWFLIHHFSNDVYNFYFSGDGLTWQFAGTITSGTSIQGVGVLFAADTDAGLTLAAAVDFLRVFDGTPTLKIGAVAA